MRDPLPTMIGIGSIGSETADKMAFRNSRTPAAAVRLALGLICEAFRLTVWRTSRVWWRSPETYSIDTTEVSLCKFWKRVLAGVLIQAAYDALARIIADNDIPPRGRLLFVRVQIGTCTFEMWMGRCWRLETLASRTPPQRLSFMGACSSGTCICVVICLYCQV